MVKTVLIRIILRNKGHAFVPVTEDFDGFF